MSEFETLQQELEHKVNEFKHTLWLFKQSQPRGTGFFDHTELFANLQDIKRLIQDPDDLRLDA